MIQHIIVFIIIGLAVAYTIVSIIRSLQSRSAGNSSCNGCSGCSVSNGCSAKSEVVELINSKKGCC